MRALTKRSLVAATAIGIIAAGTTAALAKEPVPAPTADPSHGGIAHRWTVVLPPLFPEVGPTSTRLPSCSTDQVKAHATTRLLPGGVAGIVRLKGEHCSIYSQGGPDELRHGDATLPIDATPWSDQTDPLDTARSDIPRNEGNLEWSFTWTGSWCGKTATSIVVPLVKSGGDVVAPLAGPQPPCVKGHAGPALLVPGAPGLPGIPDQAPGADWNGLTASLAMPKTLHSTAIRHLVVTFSNSTGAAIPLAPCPTYALGAAGKRADETAQGYGRSLPCPYEPRIVPAHGHRDVDLPASAFDRDIVPAKGGRLTVTFEILGVPPATAHAHVTRLAG